MWKSLGGILVNIDNIIVPLEVPGPKTLGACGPLGYWPWNSLGTIFTRIPPRHFHILYQSHIFIDEKSDSKSALLHNFAGQRTKSPWFCGAKNKGSVILRAKSALLHNFAGQSLHWSIILQGKAIDFRAKIQQEMWFSYFLKKYFSMWLLFKRSLAPWWPLFRKKLNCWTVPLTATGCRS